MFRKVKAFSFFLCFWWLSNSTTSKTIPIAKPGCQTSCGNVTIYYPFGIGLDNECSLSDVHKIFCNTTLHPPKPFLSTSNFEVFDISINGQMRINNNVAVNYYEEGVIQLNLGEISTSLNKLPVVFSDTENKLTVLGCDDYAYIYGTLGRKYTSGCIVGCSMLGDVINGSCSGIGCCQTSIPKGLKKLKIDLNSFSNHKNISYFNPYSFAFIAEQDKFTFNIADLNDPTFVNRIQATVPRVLDWYVGLNQSCLQAKRNLANYACQENTQCTDMDGALGYRCSCLPGYEGNPYLTPSCVDIDECISSASNQCSGNCINTLGGYNCTCPKGYRGDGWKNGTTCNSHPSKFITRLSLGLSLGFFSIVMSMSWICFTMIRRRHVMNVKEKFFEQNGGLLLKEKLSQTGRTMESSKIFSTIELQAATNNFSKEFIVGEGGYGIVYKGILKDGSEVAIKKSRVVDQTQVELFINEVVILTQINHRNVVKLLGCCLETEVPLLVYQYISNGTLFKHIHKNKGITSWLTWATCIKLASEAADALMYLHSAASTPIIHRDVKSSNILLDESYIAKISDFGASRLVPIDQAQVTTLVQGTMGYLDPEYFHTGQLTEKSDVYSFGVVLAELLTKEKPLCSKRKIEERNLATYFVLAMK